MHPSIAAAQVSITCPQSLRFGQLATCGNGAFTLSAGGLTSTIGSCALILGGFQNAQCIVKATGSVKKSVKVQFTANNIQITNVGNKERVDNFEMIYTGTTNPQNTLKLTPTEVNNTVVINVGATLDFPSGQPLGQYIGQITITAN